MPQAEGPPKRVSLVGADDLRKMQEEEGEDPNLRSGLGGVMTKLCLMHLPVHSSQAAAEEGTDASGRGSNLRT